MTSDLDAPLKIFRPTWRFRDWIFALILVLYGGGCMLFGGAMWIDLVTNPQAESNLIERILGYFGFTSFFLFGLFMVLYTVLNLLRFDRIFTAVYRDRIVVSTAIRLRNVPLTAVRRAVRSDDSEEGFYLELTSRHRLRDAALQTAVRLEQEEFAVLINTLIAEPSGRD